METPREPPVVLESKPLEISEEFGITEEKIITTLGDDCTNTIGIFGHAGVGESGIMRRISKKVLREKLFKVVMMLRVGPSYDPERIAYAIYDHLSVKFEGGDVIAQTIELLSNLVIKEKVLIILDDVWEFLDLERIGIPLQKHNGSLKVVITSQFKKVCVGMGCNVIFKLKLGKSIGSSGFYPSRRSAVGYRIPPHVKQPIFAKFSEYILSHKKSISKTMKSINKASGGNMGPKCLYDIDAMNFFIVSNQNTMKEEDVVDSLESYSQDLGEKRQDEGASMLSFGTRNGGEVEEMNDEAKSEEYINMVLRNKRYLKDFILFCSVFPFDYEFTKDILVWQWIAGGLIELGEDEKMEEVSTECFDTLLGMSFIVPSGHDYFVDQIKYKLGDKMITFLQKQPLEPKFGKYLDNKQSDPTKVELLSLTFKEIDRVKLVLKRYCHLQTLVIHDCYEVDRLPADLFLELKTLKILNLSHTNIVELPSSVENLKELRFFDMSETPIGWLPETICSFSHLQTLNLDGCLQLEGLPKRTSKLINLRHLILDVVRQLQSMPVGIGKLSNLRTLSAFMVDEDDGCSVRQLKDLNKLRGSFRLLNLENVETKEEASEACLCNKVDLRKIELQWSVVQDEKNPREEEILESLQPPVGIEELKILFYSGGVLPSWICNPSFSELVSIILYRCRYCVSLTSLGELPSLKCLSIIENNEVIEIDSSFCRKQTNQYHVAFPKLEKLSFDSMFKLEKWSGLEKGDFPCLRRLIIEYCPKFVELPFLSRLNSLLHLEILYCPELSCSPEDELPLTLESLMIKESPKLKDQCCDEGWSKVARVPTVYFENQKFSPKM